MTYKEKCERFLRVSGVWDMKYQDGTKLSDRLAKFVEEEVADALKMGDFEWLRAQYRRIAEEQRD